MSQTRAHQVGDVYENKRWDRSDTNFIDSQLAKQGLTDKAVFDMQDQYRNEYLEKYRAELKDHITQ